MAKKNKSKKKNAKQSALPWKKAAKAGLTAGVWLWDFLWAMIEVMPVPGESRGDHMRRLGGWPKEIQLKRLHHELKRAKDRGWIIVAEKQGKKFLKLTEKGVLEILYRKLRRLPKPTKRQWDGTWWMALFDIPEKGRAERDIIRRTLCAAGFYRLQKSVYVYPREIPSELLAYLNAKKLMPYIRFVHVDRMDGSQMIEKHFQVKR